MSRTLVFSALVLFAALPLAGCSSEIDDKPAAKVKDASGTVEAKFEAKSAAGKALPLDVAQSTLEFVGAKVTGDHHGTFKDLAGSLVLNPDGSVSTLQVEVQTASLAVEPEKLQGHLKSADFFDVEKYPEAKFSLDTFTPASSGEATHKVAGQLELHGVTKQIEFPAKVTFSEGEVTATAQFTINRKDFGIVYPGKTDDLIRDDVLLDVKLRFPKS
jgi:polyisoprenoid-binding protein YceI